jgi:hypothetical protein
MNERDARAVYLARAFEEADREGLLLPPHEREAATRAAAAEIPPEDDAAEQETESARRRDAERIARRAHRLLESLPASGPALRAGSPVAGAGPWIAAGALAVGLATHALGPERQINLLSFPLLALLGWNLLVYAGMLAGALHRRARARRAAAATHPAVGSLTAVAGGTWQRWALWPGWGRVRRAVGDAERAVIAEAWVRFADAWLHAAAPLLVARARRALHLAAIAMITGVVTGMYARGLAFEFRATWESTLLGPRQVQRLLDVVLGPAAFLLGTRVPPIAPLQHQPGEAAPWLHLYAVTALLVVVVPRGALWIGQTWRARQLARRVPVPLQDPYFVRLLARSRGASVRIEVLPYSYRPRPATVDFLKALLHDFFGARADVRVGEPAAYGAEPPPPAALEREARETCRVALFNLAQTPEPEVHGAFLERLKAQLERGREQLLVLVDPTLYAERIDAPERVDERLRTWQRAAGELGLTVVPLEARAGSDALLGRLRAALWPRAGAGTS